MGSLERGFKTWAERIAAGIRREMGLSPAAPVRSRDLADYLGVRLWTPHDVPGLTPDALKQLTKTDPDGWSAVSCEVNGKVLIIYNPCHSPGRQASDISHELAHIILEHDPGKIVMSQDGNMIMRSFDRKQEEEANWLGWCLLLPREALVSALGRGWSVSDIADKYCASKVLVEYRLRMTGVQVQFRRRH